jgi:hypothetical protein
MSRNLYSEGVQSSDGTIVSDVALFNIDDQSKWDATLYVDKNNSHAVAFAGNDNLQPGTGLCVDGFDGASVFCGQYAGTSPGGESQMYPQAVKGNEYNTNTENLACWSGDNNAFTQGGASGAPIYSMTGDGTGSVIANGLHAGIRLLTPRDQAGNQTGPATPDDMCYSPIASVQRATGATLYTR